MSRELLVPVSVSIPILCGVPGGEDRLRVRSAAAGATGLQRPERTVRV